MEIQGKPPLIDGYETRACGLSATSPPKAKVARNSAQGDPKRRFHERLASADVSRIDLLVRWGGMRRLSGMLPVQTVYSDFYVVEDLWPDYEAEQFHEALRWYARQDVTLGG